MVHLRFYRTLEPEYEGKERWKRKMRKLYTFRLMGCDENERILTIFGTCLLLKYIWNVVNWRTSADSGAQSRKYLIDLIVGKKSVPGACNAMLTGAFHLKIEVKPQNTLLFVHSNVERFGFRIHRQMHMTLETWNLYVSILSSYH